MALVLEQNYTLIQATVSLGVNPKTLSTWVQNARQQSVNLELSPNEREELYHLRRENKELRIEKEILKKASVDSIGQCNSHVKTYGCGGSFDEAYIYNKGKSVCF